jgi:predicted N-formylglutamate amidohydrolase
MTSHSDFAPVEQIAALKCGDAMDDLVLVCDHASNAEPPGVALGLGADDLGRHIAWDVGARGVTLGLAEQLGCAAVLSRWSRLVIDPNRGEDDPTLVMRLYDGSIIPGNRHVDQAEIERRLETLYRPYHRAVGVQLDEVLAARGSAVLVSIHSFTPQLRGRPRRPWHVGLLWDGDDRLVVPLLARLRAEADLVVGNNEPYSGQLRGDCMYMHGTVRGIPHVLIEVRNDLIEDAQGQARWATRLASALRAAIADMRLAEQDVPAI